MQHTHARREGGAERAEREEGELFEDSDRVAMRLHMCDYICATAYVRLHMCAWVCLGGHAEVSEHDSMTDVRQLMPTAMPMVR